MVSDLEKLYENLKFRTPPLPKGHIKIIIPPKKKTNESKVLNDWNQINVSELGMTFLPADCCFSQLAL